MLALIDEQVCDTLFMDPALGFYPDWTGSSERVEDGVRYVYETAYDAAAHTLRYTKTRYDTGETVETLLYDAQTASRIE